jgi:thioesterase domain-containing protein
MARQLEAAGEQIGLLMMLDPSPPFTNSRGLPRGPDRIPAAIRGRSRLARFVLRRLKLYASEWKRMDWPQRIAYARAKLNLAREMVLRRDPFRGDRSEIHRVAVYEANRTAGHRYVPGRFAGHAIVALTDGRAIPGPRNHRLDWLGLLPQCESAHYVPGSDTGDMLVPPNVVSLAERVNDWLERAHARTQMRDTIAVTASVRAALTSQPA